MTPKRTSRFSTPSTGDARVPAAGTNASGTDYEQNRVPWREAGMLWTVCHESIV